MDNKLQMDARQAIRKNCLYRYWLMFRKWQQLRMYRKTVHKKLFTVSSERVYNPELISRLLSEKSLKRNKINGKCKVVGFGTCSWERYGLWDAFSKNCEFSLFDYGKYEAANKLRPGEASRREIANAFLKFVEEQEKREPVSLCFFYADTIYISADLLKSLSQKGIWTVIMGLDDKHRYYNRIQYKMEIGQESVVKHADLMWTTWKSGAQIILNDGGISWYAPEAADPDYYFPIKTEKDLDVVFVGQAYGKRADLVAFLKKCNIKVDCWGRGWPNGFLSQKDMVKIFNRAKIVIGNGGVQSMDNIMHLKGRDFEVPMCGSVYLTSFNSELAEMFSIGNDILCYGSFEEAGEICKWLLQRPEMIRQIGESARDTCLRKHTWEIRIRQLLNLFDFEKIRKQSCSE